MFWKQTWRCIHNAWRTWKWRASPTHRMIRMLLATLWPIFAGYKGCRVQRGWQLSKRDIAPFRHRNYSLSVLFALSEYCSKNRVKRPLRMEGRKNLASITEKRKYVVWTKLTLSYRDAKWINDHDIYDFPAKTRANWSVILWSGIFIQFYMALICEMKSFSLILPILGSFFRGVFLKKGAITLGHSEPSFLGEQVFLILRQIISDQCCPYPRLIAIQSKYWQLIHAVFTSQHWHNPLDAVSTPCVCFAFLGRKASCLLCSLDHLLGEMNPAGLFPLVDEIVTLIYMRATRTTTVWHCRNDQTGFRIVFAAERLNSTGTGNNSSPFIIEYEVGVYIPRLSAR